MSVPSSIRLHSPIKPDGYDYGGGYELMKRRPPSRGVGNPGVEWNIAKRPSSSGPRLNLRWTPAPVVLAPRDSGNCIRALVYSYFTTVTARGPPRLDNALNRLGVPLGCLEALYPKIKIPKDPQKDRPPNPKP